MREKSFDKSFVAYVRTDDRDPRVGAEYLRAHRVHAARRRFLARSATTTTVTTLPPVNQGFYSVNCRALTSVSH